ncbi:MAG: Heat-inducible transcription repressor hrcA [Parcubacteria group bacterium GW2011_GWA1_50_14]|uniref:Heat-inducible transcription repressor HrcA C-terminal domain-containing protein n=1 Tax=Candidatus Liptonbacteria bacterium GWB1_49_6 TaxID=1798644 RepID=A0A1G2C744_9BACT|nr:MAG: Heat-inducible transcription repressor hrcA [Parcubacteria group bacterium GW2011_GWA1_50_14]OGY96307.1 MAG: hypothetical protein A2122_00695 [Candidatus Liptonbacteria bacterium GWB1_49_6]
MPDRTFEILEAVVAEFIRTGEAVSSAGLFGRYDFGIRPAMIRSELQELTDAGFLEQLYHSAGRVPSDKAYQFFVEKVIERTKSDAHPTEKIRISFRNADWNDFSEALASHLGLLCVVDDVREEAVYKEGLDNLVRRLDWDSPEEIKQVIRDFEELDNRVSDFAKGFVNEDGLDVFIGRRSPVTKSGQLAVVAANCESDDGNLVILGIGPKWMDYKKVIGTFKSFQNVG